ncbi:hypothetical protein STEG23_000549 [Scotinomys teguina]
MASTSLEIIAFTVSISGWVLVSSTLPTDYWKVSTIDGTVITTATYFANLWKICVTDSTGVANCKEFPSMLALDGLHPFGPPSPFLPLAGFPGGRVHLGTRCGPPGKEAGSHSVPREGLRCSLSGYIQACRGLMIAAVSLGFFGSIFALFGMKCTKVGGSDKAKAKIACLAGIVFILSGLCSMTGCSLYANKITTEFFDPLYMEQKTALSARSDFSDFRVACKHVIEVSVRTVTQHTLPLESRYELGAALFIGWAGASLCIIGGVIFCFSISDNNKTPRMGYTYNGPTSVMSSRTKYHSGEGDFKTTSPSKQFDKNAYV